ncbi:long-chain-fatty-acid--CoA ligase [Bacillus sp. JCM 19047]|nr:long-chain-fatty-acid--CoA ligase [Bacillus sp. JCM 19047]
MNRIKWHQSMFQLKSGERVAQKTSCCFDVSVWELFWPIMYGGTICPVERDIVRNPWEFADWVTKEQINVLHFVPSMFSEFINAIQGEGYEFKQLRWLLFSGEALPLPVIQKWQGVYGGKIGLANLYGPTEASIDVTCHIIPTSYDKEEKAIPIGKPIDGVDVYILDEQRQRVATGRIGELYIGGIQVAKGYINNPEQTDQRFIPNPFSTRSGDMLYRTGDLGSWRDDGQIDYHGRTDSQIKIRGYRVELGEIEAT